MDGEKMARISILKRCCEIIRNHEEEDWECRMVGYHLSYNDGVISFHRVTTYPTGETFSDGGIDTKSCGSELASWDATLEDYCNLAIAMHHDDLKYSCGYEVRQISFKGIY